MDKRITDFLSDSSHRRLGASEESAGVPAPEFLSEILPGKPLIALPAPDSLNYHDKGLRQAIEERRTLRRLEPNDAISLEELSVSLWLTQGVIEVNDNRQDTLRNVASAGRRHPFETYLAVRNVPGLAPGIYHYIAQEHSLQCVDENPEKVEAVANVAYKQKQMLTAPVIFIWVAHTSRTTWRYGMRGMRYIFIDAGHVCQNLYLAAELYNGAVCAIGAYEDDDVNQVLGLDGSERFVAYMASLGRKQSKAA